MSNPYLEAYKQRQLRACQLKQLSILEEIDRICRKHEIPYWLDGGTLLGAVRHGGFIPWDDDIDIAMRKSDMERFIAIAPAELRKGLFLQTPQNEPQSKEPIVKVRDLNSLYIEGSDNFAADYEKGLYVDIFPMINYPTLPRKLVRWLTLGISRSYSILHKSHYYSFRSFVEFFWFGAKYAFCRGLWWLLNGLSRKDTYLSNVLVNNGYGIMHRQDVVFPLGDITFEGKEFPSPASPHAYLSDLYHNYMQIPPKEKQQIHSVFIQPELISATD
ncbi:MAG: LicD family protein [Bacteroidaceae bacterium]|nr:LicD family protein [Bacteroidaceae bacterium]